MGATPFYSEYTMGRKVLWQGDHVALVGYPMTSGSVEVEVCYEPPFDGRYLRVIWSKSFIGSTERPSFIDRVLFRTNTVSEAVAKGLDEAREFERRFAERERRKEQAQQHLEAVAEVQKIASEL